MALDVKVGFIGAGMMASAMIKGFIDSKILKTKILASDIDEGAKTRIENLGALFVKDNRHLAKESQVVFLAVKPHIVPKVLAEISSDIGEYHLIVSIAAGTTLQTIQRLLPQGTRVIRVMPNTPGLVNCMAAAFCPGKTATAKDLSLVESLLKTLGVAFHCEERLLNAVTGLSGSGPAYIFILIEALADGGVRQGIPRAMALRLAAQTVKGAAQMVLDTGKHPGELKDQVCSPGGTTIAGVEALESGAFRSNLIRAVSAATKRAEELSNM